MTSHVQVEIGIRNQRVFVDEGIVPVIHWLSSFESVVTRFSCQGGKCKKCGGVVSRNVAGVGVVDYPCNHVEQTNNAYVMWTCGTQLTDILKVLDDFVESGKVYPPGHPKVNIVTEITVQDGEVIYTTKWHDNDTLNLFIEYLYYGL